MSTRAPENRPLIVERTFTAKTYDIDFAGHVSNIVYIRWLEDLRLAFLDDYFPLEGQLAQGYGPVLVRTEIDYKSAVRLFEPVTGQIWATGAGIVKMYLEAVIKVGDRVCATARQCGVMANLADGRPIRLPAKLRSMILAGLDPAAGGS
jgi:acyl-CoA thioester hydrolase